MKRKNLITIGGTLLFFLVFILIGFQILAYGYGGGKAAKPVKPNEFIINLEKEIAKEVKSN